MANDTERSVSFIGLRRASVTLHLEQPTAFAYDSALITADKVHFWYDGDGRGGWTPTRWALGHSGEVQASALVNEQQVTGELPYIRKDGVVVDGWTDAIRDLAITAAPSDDDLREAGVL